MKPLNGNILVKPIRNQTEKIFQEGDSRKDLQYATVIALPPEDIILNSSKNSSIVAKIGAYLKKILNLNNKLKIGDKVVYNPRQLTTIIYEHDTYGMVHFQNLVAVV